MSTFVKHILITSFGIGLILAVVFPLLPDGQSAWIVIPCLVITTFILISRFFRKSVIANDISLIFRPDTLFLTFFYIIFVLPYVSSYIGDSDLNQNRFITSVFMEHANRAVVAALIAAVFFVFGYRQFESIDIKMFKGTPSAKSELILAHRAQYVAFVLLLILFILFLVSGAWRQLSGQYTGLQSGEATSDGIYFLLTHFSMLLLAITIASCVIKRQITTRAWVYMALPLIWAGIIMISGDRNSGLLIVAILGIGVSTYFYRISIVAWVASAILALFIYQAIEVSRSTGGRDFSSFTSALFNSTTDSGGVAESSFSLTTITSRASFQDEPDGSAIYYGKFKLIGFMGVVPYSRGLFFSPSKEHVTSSDYISEIVLGPNSSWSIGSNIISDIVIDFGVALLPVTMAMVGALGGFAFRYAQSFRTVLSITLYLFVASLYFEYPRYTLDFPVRSIVWLILFFWLIKKFSPQIISSSRNSHGYNRHR